MASPAPIQMKEALALPELGINPQFIAFTHVTMESDKYICVRETGASNQVVIVDMSNPRQPLRRPITADSAMMNPVANVIALKAAVPNTTQDHLQIFNIEQKAKMKAHQMPEQVVFWKWISPTMLGLVTATAVYHWSIEGESPPVKVFDRAANLNGNQIINYRADPSEKWLVLIGIAPGAAERPQLVKGNLQLFSVEQNRSQALEAHAAVFATFTVSGNVEPSTLIAFSSKTLAGSKLHIIELGAKAGNTVPFAKKSSDLFFPPEFADDFPVSMQSSQKYGLIYVITKLGLLFVYDVDSGAAVYRNRISPDPIFLTADSGATGGFYAINRQGRVLLTTVNEQTIVPFISQQLQNIDLALAIAQRANLPGAEALVVPKFESLFAMGNYKAAAELAAASPQGTLRTQATVQKFMQAVPQPGQQPPLLQYFGVLLTKGKLNAFESLELAKLVLSQQKKQLLETWLAEDKLECSEPLGDMIGMVDRDLALKVWVKAKATPKVVAAFAERGEYEMIAKYSQQVGYTPDYMFLLQKVLSTGNAQAALNLAMQVAQMTPPPLDYNTVADLFLKGNLVREATSFLLTVLKPNLPEQAALQTKVLEINLVAFPSVADAILANNMFTHYDRPRIAQLCEKAGLYVRALAHYTDLSDIKRCVVNTHGIEPAALIDFFGHISREWAIECLKEMLAHNMRGNMQLVVQIAKEFTEQLTAEAIIGVFESFHSYEGLYFYLGSYLAFSQDPQVHFKYIEAAAKTGQLAEVERVTRESTSYDPAAVKQFLMEAKLPDARPLINVCDRFDFISDLTHYLYANQMMKYIEAYVQKVNPSKAPQVVGGLLDVECPDEFIRNLISSVRHVLPVEPLVEECEKRNRLKLLLPFLDHLVQEGSQDPHVHNAMGKILVDSNNNPEHFLTTNPYYDSRVVGKHCEKRDPNLACIAYKRGKCDAELIDVTNRNSLFKQQARYVVERMEPELWATVLSDENAHRRQLIDQVVGTALPESKNPDHVSVTVKAFMAADMPNELIELLEKIVLHNSSFSGNPNLQNLLILTAIKADKSRVMDYINRLDNFDGPAVGDIAVSAELYEEAFAIFKKFNNNVQAIKVLLDNLNSIARALEFANKVDESGVWSALGKAQLAAGLVADAIASFTKAKDTTNYMDVIKACEEAGCYPDLVKFLKMVRQKVKEPRVDTELVYALAKCDELGEMEEFLAQPNTCNQQVAGDRCYDDGMYEAAKILFTLIPNYARLASTLVKLRQFQAAVDAARKANAPKTWKEVCFACVVEREFRLAQLCGLQIIVQADELEEISEFYQKHGFFVELLALMESGLGLERAHMGIFTELGCLYAKYKHEKLMEHLKLFSAKLNIPKLIRVCEEMTHWKELAFLYVAYDEYDNAAQCMMMHSEEAWDNIQFKDVIVKVANVEMYYRSVQFYLDEHPLLLNDLLAALTPRVDHTRVVDLMRKVKHLALVKTYLLSVQKANLNSVNDAVNDLLIEEEDYDGLRQSINLHDNFDQIALAQKVEKHELLEFRRIASYIYKRAKRWRQSVNLSKADKMYRDAMETTAVSSDKELAEELLSFFVEEKNKECFAACLYTCYDLIPPDVALELAWMSGMMDFAMPYMVQVVREYVAKVDVLVEEKNKAVKEEVQQHAAAEVQNSNMHATMLMLPAPPGMGYVDPAYAAQQQGYHGGPPPGMMPYGQPRY